MYTNDPNYIAALTFVNEIRARYHQPLLTELLPGHTCSAGYCVISNSLRDCSVSEEVSTTPGYARILHNLDEEFFETPPEVHQFIVDFDCYMYPSLELRKYNS